MLAFNAWIHLENASMSLIKHPTQWKYSVRFSGRILLLRLQAIFLERITILPILHRIQPENGAAHKFPPKWRKQFTASDDKIKEMADMFNVMGS